MSASVAPAEAASAAGDRADRSRLHDLPSNNARWPQTRKAPSSRPHLDRSLQSQLAVILTDIRENGLRAWLRTNTAFVAIIVYAVLYLLIGAIFYTQYEKWPLLDALYFSIVTASTVGYGDVVPQEIGAKWFTIFYMLFGFGLFTIVLSARVRSVSAKSRLLETHQLVEDLLYASDGRNEELNRNRRWNLAKALAIQLFFLLCFLGVGTLFYALNNNLVFIDALYLCMATGTTIGYGDVSPTIRDDGRATIGGKWFALFYVTAFVVFVLNLLSWITAELSRAFTSAEVVASMKGDLNSRLLEALDVDSDRRIDRTEWVSAVLIANNVCSENLLRLILHRFDELDADKNGFLDEKDIEILQAQKSQAAA